MIKESVCCKYNVGEGFKNKSQCFIKQKLDAMKSVLQASRYIPAYMSCCDSPTFGEEDCGYFKKAEVKETTSDPRAMEKGFEAVPKTSAIVVGEKAKEVDQSLIDNVTQSDFMLLPPFDEFPEENDDTSSNILSTALKETWGRLIALQDDTTPEMFVSAKHFIGKKSEANYLGTELLDLEAEIVDLEAEIVDLEAEIAGYNFGNEKESSDVLCLGLKENMGCLMVVEDDRVPEKFISAEESVRQNPDDGQKSVEALRLTNGIPFNNFPDYSFQTFSDGFIPESVPHTKRKHMQRLMEEFEGKKLRREVKRWSSHEEDVLRDGVLRFGYRWATIKDCYKEVFNDRTNVDLKDKWRNMLKRQN